MSIIVCLLSLVLQEHNDTQGIYNALYSYSKSISFFEFYFCHISLVWPQARPVRWSEESGSGSLQSWEPQKMEKAAICIAKHSKSQHVKRSKTLKHKWFCKCFCNAIRPRWRTRPQNMAFCRRLPGDNSNCGLQYIHASRSQRTSRIIIRISLTCHNTGNGQKDSKRCNTM